MSDPSPEDLRMARGLLRAFPWCEAVVFAGGVWKLARQDNGEYHVERVDDARADNAAAARH